MQEANEQEKIQFQDMLYNTARDYTPVIRAIEQGIGFSPRWPIFDQRRGVIAYLDTLDVYSILIDSCQDKSKPHIPLFFVSHNEYEQIYEVFKNLNGYARQELIQLLQENESDTILLPVFGVPTFGSSYGNFGAPNDNVVFELETDVFIDMLIAQEFEHKENVERNNVYYEIGI